MCVQGVQMLLLDDDGGERWRRLANELVFGSFKMSPIIN